MAKHQILHNIWLSRLYIAGMVSPRFGWLVVEDGSSEFHAGFRDAPPTPPSLSRQLETANKHVPVSGCQQLIDFIVASVLSLKNIYFLLYVIVSGMLNSSDVILVLSSALLPSLVPRPIPSFSMLHDEKWAACNIEKLEMGLGTRLLLPTCFSYDVQHWWKTTNGPGDEARKTGKRVGSMEKMLNS